MNMYVGNLNYRVKEGDLEQAMAAYGVVTSVKVIKEVEVKDKDSDTKRSAAEEVSRSNKANEDIKRSELSIKRKEAQIKAKDAATKAKIAKQKPKSDS